MNFIVKKRKILLNPVSYQDLTLSKLIKPIYVVIHHIVFKYKLTKNIHGKELVTGQLSSGKMMIYSSWLWF